MSGVDPMHLTVVIIVLDSRHIKPSLAFIALKFNFSLDGLDFAIIATSYKDALEHACPSRGDRDGSRAIPMDKRARDMWVVDSRALEGLTWVPADGSGRGCQSIWDMNNRKSGGLELSPICIVAVDESDRICKC